MGLSTLSKMDASVGRTALAVPGAMPVDAARVVESFRHYMHAEGTDVPRAAFLEQLELRLRDRGFCSDMDPLLRTGLSYDPQQAGRLVRELLLTRLP